MLIHKHNGWMVGWGYLCALHLVTHIRVMVRYRCLWTLHLVTHTCTLMRFSFLSAQYLWLLES